MTTEKNTESTILSVIIPCYNEEQTLEKCVERVLEIESDQLKLEIIIIDDHSTDRSTEIGQKLAADDDRIRYIRHGQNMGKGAALKTGFQAVSGDIVAIQDADLEYDPWDLVRLVEPIRSGIADVVFGSRFLSHGVHRILYFWHSLGNKFLTFLSNMFTDLNLSDMETCYKVFKREVVQELDLEEKRFGVEPEIVAKVAQMRLRIYEMGISYHGRTYEEGKKISYKDGLRALYCIFHYNMPRAPTPVQFLIYLFIGIFCGLINLGVFLSLYPGVAELKVSAFSAYFVAAVINYLLCTLFLFRHKAKWSVVIEWVIYALVVTAGAFVDYYFTKLMMAAFFPVAWAKIIATLVVFVFNFAGRKWLVFPERGLGPWKPQQPS